MSLVYEVVTANKSLVIGDLNKIFIVTVASITITLPDAVTVGEGWGCSIKNMSGDPITLAAAGSDTVDGLASVPLIDDQSLQIYLQQGTDFFTADSFVPIFWERTQFQAMQLSAGASPITLTTLNSFVTVMTLDEGEIGLLSKNIVNDYIDSSPVEVDLLFSSDTTTAGDFSWTVFYQYLAPGDTIETTGTAASEVSIVAAPGTADTTVLTSFVLPGVTLEAGLSLILAVELTGSPAATSGQIHAIEVRYLEAMER